jgi:hypothetical protein
VFKLLVKLAIVALLGNAAYHVGAEYLTYFKFRDAIRDAAIFKARTNTELMARILDLGVQYELPVSEENITIERKERRVNIDGWYDQPIEIFPNYTYPWHFGLSVEVVSQTLPPTP